MRHEVMTRETTDVFYFSTEPTVLTRGSTGTGTVTTESMLATGMKTRDTQETGNATRKRA